MTRRRVLVLGTGGPQVDLIQAARNHLGAEVHGCGHVAAGPGLAQVDAFHLIDLRDLDGLTSLAGRLQVEAVLELGSDLGMVAAAEVTHRLGLPSFLTPKQARTAADKVARRRLLPSTAPGGVAWRAADTLEPLLDWGIYPAYIKPATGQGQRGVSRIVDPRELPEAFQLAKASSGCGRVLLEAAAEGPEHSVNLYLVEGRPVLKVVSDRYVVPGASGRPPLGHDLPSHTFPAAEAGAMDAALTAWTQALGVRNGPVYFQVRRSPEGPKVIEAVPRWDGGHKWLQIREAGGGDWLVRHLDHLLHSRPPLPAPAHLPRAVRLRYLLQPAGSNQDRASHPIPHQALQLTWYGNDGEAVRLTHGGLEKVGYWIAPLEECDRQGS